MTSCSVGLYQPDSVIYRIRLIQFQTGILEAISQIKSNLSHMVSPRLRFRLAFLIVDDFTYNTLPHFFIFTLYLNFSTK